MPNCFLQYPIFRMVHYSNVEYILRNGLCCKTHENADPDYINIGDTNLIQQRNEYIVGINPPGGNLGDFVPFYFGGHTPMLLNITTGYRGVTQRPQQDIVFICCIIENIVQECKEWCFTDGHAKNHITEFYNDLQHLNKLDWAAIQNQWWSPTLDDRDKSRKKQAEFLVKGYVPTQCIHCIIVKNEQRKTDIEEIIRGTGLNIPVKIDINNKLYYP